MKLSQQNANRTEEGKPQSIAGETIPGLKQATEEQHARRAAVHVHLYDGMAENKPEGAADTVRSTSDGLDWPRESPAKSGKREHPAIIAQYHAPSSGALNLHIPLDQVR